MEGWESFRDEHGKFAGIRQEMRVNRDQKGQIEALTDGSRKYVVLRERGRVVGFREELG